MGYRVVAPLCVIANEKGSMGHFYRDEILPEGLPAERLEQLADEGMLERIGGSDGPPAKSAKKADWEAYARSRGATDEDLDGKSKDEIVAAYSGDESE